ncbi:MAG TPA: DUF4350 domain-containing protein, partial [Polyangiaceae bacterium]|nr:DUF4350 domain-containing protein [Polyangiaceae bacterium]
LAKDARARCPQFAAACEQATTGARLPRDASEPAGDSAWLDVLAWLLRAVGLLILAGVGALLLLALLRFLLSLRRTRTESLEEPSEPTPAGAAPRVDAAPGGPERHLARARALAAAGDHARALVELHLGVVSSLDAQGALRARPGRTNGDYARELARRPELLGPFRELTRTVEAVLFGGARLDAAGFERMLQRAGALLGGAGSTLLLGLFVAAFSLGLGCGDGPEQARSATAEACGTDADGHSLLCELLETTGVSVRRRYRSLDELGNEEGQRDVIVLLRTELEPKALRALEAWVRSGGILLLTLPVPELDRQLGIERSERACGEAAIAGTPQTLVTLGGGLRAPTLEASAFCPNGDSFIARGPLDDGWVEVVPTPAALSNASLVAADNAARIVPLLFPADAVVELVGSWTRDRAENPINQVRAAGLMPWVLQLMALGLCYGLYRGQPFARRRAPPEVGRRRFSEHAQALGQRWAEAGASEAALKAYASWATAELRERLPVGTEQTVSALAQVISEKTGQPSEAVARTLERARRAQLCSEQPCPEPRPDVPFGAPLPPREPPPDEAEQLATLKSLGRMLEEIGGKR